MLTTKILYLLPPFTQLNTPYPSTAYLTGYTNMLKLESQQMDLGLELTLKIFSKKGLIKLFDLIHSENDLDQNSLVIYTQKNQYIKFVEPVILFLQGKNSSFANNINQGVLPQGSRFENLEELDFYYGVAGLNDKAKHLATLFLEDLGDFISHNIDSNFGFSRYAERLGRTASSFDPIQEYLQEIPSQIELFLLELLESKLDKFLPSAVFISVPFPGNLISAFRIAQYIKKHHPEITISMGGGYANTELRSITDSRVFNYFDFITLDDGEKPVEHIVKWIEGELKKEDLVRTFYVEHNEVIFQDNTERFSLSFTKMPTPSYEGLLLDQYISVLETGNPMHRLWSDGVWLKLTMAHGCYWKKCSFCDISLDYIESYEPLSAKVLVDRVEDSIQKTGLRSFHFVDEAAPPSLMKYFALELIKREITISWWTNIRFEKSFDQGLCMLLKESGCIAVSGGLEVASDRLLKLMQKGVSVEQVANVLSNFKAAGILTHAYLMYGFPSQTDQETIDSLEVVRQLFENELLDSGFWHQFAMTAHSPVGLNPKDYDVVEVGPIFEGFADNDRFHKDLKGADHQKYSNGLRISMYNYLTGRGLEESPNIWFDFDTPVTSLPVNLIEQYLIDSYKLKNNFLITGNSFFAESKGKEVLVMVKQNQEVVLGGKKRILNWIESINKKYGNQLIPNDFEKELFDLDWNRFTESYNFQLVLNSFWLNF